MGYVYERTFYEGGACIFKIHPQDRLVRCPICCSLDIQSRGSVERTIMLIPTGMRKNYVRVNIPRVYCHKCNKLQQIDLGFVEKYRPYSKSFERYVWELCRLMTISDVAKHLGVSWDTIKDIHKRYLNHRYGKPSLKYLNSIAIDEIYNGKKHKYLTIVLNLETGAVVFVGKGKGADALLPFWEKLGRRKNKIKSVAIDMSVAYTRAVSDNLPKATLVYDRFHVIKLYNERLSDLRRQLYNETKDADVRSLLKGTRWLLLKNEENLNDEKGERERLKKALEANRPLMTAYYLKEELHRIWDQVDRSEGEASFARWLLTAESSGVVMLAKFAETLRLHRVGILNYYDHRITTGALEGTNAKIRVMQRKAYGFRDEEYLKLKIYALHETKVDNIV
jgi:transposase